MTFLALSHCPLMLYNLLSSRDLCFSTALAKTVTMICTDLLGIYVQSLQESDLELGERGYVMMRGKVNQVEHNLIYISNYTPNKTT